MEALTIESIESIFKNLASKWPSAIVARSEIGNFSGGVLSARYMANLDCRNEGPPRVRIGGKVAYPVEDLIQWMESRAQ